jgi:hypothetical protein
MGFIESDGKAKRERLTNTLHPFFYIIYAICSEVPYAENFLAHNRLHPMLLHGMPSRTRVKKEG